MTTKSMERNLIDCARIVDSQRNNKESLVLPQEEGGVKPSTVTLYIITEHWYKYCHSYFSPKKDDVRLKKSDIYG